MINRYEGNTGRVTRLPEQHDLPPPPTPERRPADDPAVDTDGYRGVLAGISVTVPVEALPSAYWDAYLPVTVS